jgi:hypothetical protein
MGEKYKIGKLRAANVAIGDHATAEYTRHVLQLPFFGL